MPFVKLNRRSEVTFGVLVPAWLKAEQIDGIIPYINGGDGCEVSIASGVQIHVVESAEEVIKEMRRQSPSGSNDIEPFRYEFCEKCGMGMSAVEVNRGKAICWCCTQVAKESNVHPPSPE